MQTVCKKPAMLSSEPFSSSKPGQLPLQRGGATSQVLPIAGGQNHVTGTSPSHPSYCPSVLLYTRHAHVCSYTSKQVMPKELQVRRGEGPLPPSDVVWDL